MPFKIFRLKKYSAIKFIFFICILEEILKNGFAFLVDKSKLLPVSVYVVLLSSIG